MRLSSGAALSVDRQAGRHARTGPGRGGRCGTRRAGRRARHCRRLHAPGAGQRQPRRGAVFRRDAKELECQCLGRRAVRLQPYFMLGTSVATHGSPHRYDTHVPILMYGPEMGAARPRGQAGGSGGHRADPGAAAAHCAAFRSRRQAASPAGALRAGCFFREPRRLRAARRLWQCAS
jgi:hypothetical protein